MPAMAAAEPEALDEEFLEFLGSWEGNDDDWLELMEAAQARVLEESGENVKTAREADSDE